MNQIEESIRITQKIIMAYEESIKIAEECENKAKKRLEEWEGTITCLKADKQEHETELKQLLKKQGAM